MITRASTPLVLVHELFALAGALLVFTLVYKRQMWTATAIMAAGAVVYALWPSAVLLAIAATLLLSHGTIAMLLPRPGA